MADPRERPTGPTVSLTKAAEELGVHYMTAYRYVRTGRLAASKVGAEWRVPIEDLRSLAEHGVTEVGPGRRRASGPQSSGRLADRLVAGDEAGGWQIIETALVGGSEPAEVLTELIGSAMRTIGDRWSAGELSVADEHRASVVCQRLIGRLGPRFARRGRKRGQIVVGSVVGDRHSIPPSILADLLRGAGYEVCDLGADCPVESFIATAASMTRLVAVCLSVSHVDALESAGSTTTRIRASLGGDVVIVVGGGAVIDAHIALRLGSDGYAADALAAVELIELLVASSRSTAPV